MSNIVWSPERGWHDGGPATVATDGRGRIVAHSVTYHTRRSFHGYPYRTDAQCACGWSISVHGDTPEGEARAIGEQHTRGEVVPNQ